MMKFHKVFWWQHFVLSRSRTFGCRNNAFPSCFIRDCGRLDLLSLAGDSAPRNSGFSTFKIPERCPPPSPCPGPHVSLFPVPAGSVQAPPPPFALCPLPVPFPPFSTSRPFLPSPLPSPSFPAPGLRSSTSSRSHSLTTRAAAPARGAPCAPRGSR